MKQPKSGAVHIIGGGELLHFFLANFGPSLSGRGNIYLDPIHL